jgi:phosphoglycolate phosphatase-like HAD superfamily hydrolase
VDTAPPPWTIIFDFDGTIADTLEHSRLVGNTLAPRFGLSPISAAEFEALRDLTVVEIQRRLKFPSWKIPIFLFFFRQRMLQQLSALDCVVGMPETLRTLQSCSINLGILTSNQLSNVTYFLAHHQLASCFQFVDGGARVLGKGARLRGLIRRHHLNPQRVFYVGDEVRDIVAAHQAGVSSIAVSWGFNTRNALEAAHPTVLLDQPQQLCEWFALHHGVTVQGG